MKPGQTDPTKELGPGGYRDPAEREAKIRRALETQTRQAEDELRAIIDNAPVFLWSDLPDGYCDFLNQRWLTYFNLSLQEAQGAGWATLLHPDDAAHHLESWQKSVSTGTPFETEARFRRSDGEYRCFLTRAIPLHDKTGKIVKWYGTNIDIENLKRTERRLRQSEAYLAEAQRLSHTGTWAFNATTTLYWSEESYRIWGLDPLQGLPSRETVWQRIHPDDRDRVYEEAQLALQQKRDLAIEFRIVLPDGTVKYLESISSPVFSALGELVEVIGTHVDVTERKRAEKALRESEAKIRRLVDANIIGIIMWDFEGRVIEANDAFLRMVGYDREDLVSGRIRWTDLTPPEWRDRDERGWVPELKKTGSLQPFEKEYFRKDGSRVPVLIGVATFEEGGNQGVAFVLDLTVRKQAEEALRESEYKLRKIIETVPGLLWTAAPDGEITQVNQQVLDYTGMQFDFLRVAWNKMLHPDDISETANAFHHAIQTGTSHQAVHRLRRIDGEYLWHHTRAEPLRDRAGRIIQWYGLSVDIDEGKKAEEALRESETKFRDYAETASDWLWEIGPDYKFTLLTENAFGSDPAHRIGTVCWDHALDLESQPEKWRLVRATLDSRKPFRDFVYCSADRNGSPMYVRCSGKPVFTANGEFRGYRGTGTNVTAIMRAQEAVRESAEALRRSEAYLAESQKLSHTGTWAFNPTTTLYWSEENYRIWGFDPLQGLPSRETVWLRIHPGDRDRVLEEVREALRQKKNYAGEFRILLPNGTIKYIEATSRHIFSVHGELVEVVGTHVDVTERQRARKERERLRQLEADLAHMNRLSTMGELAASLAHEVKQPIAAARNNARAALNFLDRCPPDLGEVREALGCVVGDADRAGHIVDRVRDHIKKAPPQQDRFDLNKAVNEVIALARSEVANNGVSVQARLAEGLSPVQGDRVQLQQIVLNLILNAIEAMSSVDDGVRQLLISSEQSQADRVFVAVRDSGPGIDPEHLERVFEAFYTTKSRGIGMGLSICRSIIDAHGGRLWAEANEPRGAVFQFTLPAAEG